MEARSKSGRLDVLRLYRFGAGVPRWKGQIDTDLIMDPQMTQINTDEERNDDVATKFIVWNGGIMDPQMTQTNTDEE